MIKNVVFDIGNVLITFQPEEYLRETVTDETLRKKINQSVFLSPEWLLLDQGVISEKEAVRIFQTRCPETETLINGSMDNIYKKLLRPINENIDVFYEMKNLGYPVFLLSNYNEKAFEFILKRNRFLHDVDGMILSYKVNLLKPAQEIFHCLLKQYDLVPEETVFIDDSSNNVSAAESLGIRGIHYKNHESFRTELRGLL